MNLVWSPLYEYNASNVNVYAPLAAGVYRLSYQLGQERPVFYVGQAENLWDRLRYHLSNEETNNCIIRHRRRPCYFRFAEVEKQADRDGAERALYDHFNKPICNKVEPPGLAADINFD